jgi:hypothetical protein
MSERHLNYGYLGYFHIQFLTIDKAMEASSDDSKKVSEFDRTKEDEILYDIVKTKYNDSLARWDSLDNKASNLIGYVTIVTGLLVGIGTFELFGSLHSVISYILFFIGMGLLVLVIISSLICIRIKYYFEIPSAKEIEMIFEKNWKYQTIIRQIFISRLDTQKKIDQHLEDKVKWIGRSWQFLIIGMSMLLVFIFTNLILR